MRNHARERSFTPRDVDEKLIGTVRRVYNARKNFYGHAKRRRNWFGNIRNQARLDTAHIVGIPVRQVKDILGTPYRVSIVGMCDLGIIHEAHLDPSGHVDADGTVALRDCPGQHSECTNCDDQKCMGCRLRWVHDECVDDCPLCCS